MKGTGSTSRKRNDIVEAGDALLTREVAKTEEINNSSLDGAIIAAERWIRVRVKLAVLVFCEWSCHTVFLMSLI